MLLQYSAQLCVRRRPEILRADSAESELNLPAGLVMSSVQLIVLVAAFLLMLGLDFIVHKTRFGLALRALSQDFDAAALMGIPVNRTISITFALSAALAAAAGVMVGMTYPKIDPVDG